MKYLFFSTLMSLTFATFAQTDSTAAQPAAAKPAAAVTDSVQVSVPAPVIKVDTTETMSVLILQANVKDVQKDWAKYAATGSKGKAETVNGQYTQYGALVKNISPDPINITTRLLGTPEGVRLSVWLSDNTNFQNAKTSPADRKVALEKYVHDFAVLQYKSVVGMELKKDQTKQSALEKELNKLIKDEEKANKNIADDQRSIQRANDVVATNKADMQSSSTKIEAQKGMVQSTAADQNASKGAKKTLNELERDKKGTQRQSDNKSKDIDSWNKDIRANEKSITEYKEKQVAKNAEIEKQKIVVSVTKAKLEAIK